MKHPLLLLLILALLSFFSIILALSMGSVTISWSTLGHVIAGEGSSLHQQLVMGLRLPRAINAFITGGLLALAGGLMQVLLRNPLADPYILGISGGAAVAALLAMMLNIGGALLTGSAFLGALISTFLVFGLAAGRGGWTPTRLLLTGVVIAAGWGALISLLLAVAPERNLRGMLFWLMGDFSYAQNIWPGLLVLLFGSLLCLPVARDLNVLARGELQASALGVAIGPIRMMIYFLASLLTATAVTIAGSIGFIGLVVPHIVRLSGAHDHRFLLPASVLLGGSLLLLADTAARTLIAPQQLPVGAITAFLGIPMFLYLLRRSG